MVTLIGFNKKIRHIVQHYIKHINLRLPTIFEFQKPAIKRSRKPATVKAAGRKKGKIYHLYGDGAFGGLVLHGFLILKNKEELFAEIQAANLHSADMIMPERLADITKVVSTRQFKSQGKAKKTELNTNT